MEIIIQKDPQSASNIAARCIRDLIKKKPTAVLGLATGSTPLLLYKELIRLHKEEKIDFSSARTFNLDEYVGLDPQHASSYHSFMRRELFDHINIKSANIHIPDGKTKNIPEYCVAYEQAIKDSGGIDLQILGIGSDGHIGFNEPTSSLASRTRIKTLTKQTREDNAAFFDSKNPIPHHVITMGIGTIMESRACLLLAFGEKKAAAVAQAAEGALSAMVPASILQMHPHVKFIIDEAAASKLKRIEYYSYVFNHKPDWQQN